MAKRRNILAGFVMLVVFLALLGGCGAKPAFNGKQAEENTYLTIRDDAGRVVTLPKKPERIAVLSTSYVDLLYAVGGTAIGKPVSQSGRRPQNTVEPAEIGQATNINIEKLIALQPDFVIAYQGLHEKLVPVLESSHIPVVLLRMKTYEDVQQKILLFGEIAGTLSQAQSVAGNLRGKISDITARLPAQSHKVVILHATAKSVTVELDNSIAGSVANILKLKNIAAGSHPLTKDTNAAPYSLEKIVEGNPDIILVTMMGDAADIEKRLRADVQSNPAWAGLRAVKHKQVYYLPGDLFQLNPGIHYDEAVSYMAKVVYPEVYGNVK